MCSAEEDSLNSNIEKLGELASLLADCPDLRPWGPNKRKYRTIAWDDVRIRVYVTILNKHASLYIWA